jgi:uncharacterized protein (TIGR01777 family)
MPEKVLITGGSGMIGTRLTRLLLDRRISVVHLGRHERDGEVQTFRWDPRQGYVDGNAFKGVTQIVHLAGASIAGGRWTESYKQAILESRVNATRLLANHLRTARGSVNKVVSASAIGYYGPGTTETFREASPPGQGFLAEVVTEWEGETHVMDDLGIQTAMVRTGIVLSEKGGALQQMARPIRLGLGAPLGSGNQIVSWIHIDDLCGVYMHLLDNDLSGPFNATAPEAVSNRELTEAIASRLGKPLWLPNVPAFVLKLMLGEMSDAVLTGNRVSSDKIVAAGYSFRYADVASALRNIKL